MGEVVDADANQQSKAGDQEFGSIPIADSFKSGKGALAQYMHIPARAITHQLEAGQGIFINGESTNVERYSSPGYLGVRCMLVLHARMKSF